MLRAVHYLYEHVLRVGRPADAGKIALVVKVLAVYPDCAAAGFIPDSETDMLTGHTVHRIANLPEGTGACAYVQKGELRYLSLVLAVECKL